MSSLQPLWIGPLFIVGPPVEITPLPSEEGEALQKTVSYGSEPSRVEPPRLSSGVFACPPAVHWFAAYTTPRHEKRVAQHFAQRQIESYLPLYRAARKWKDGSRVTLELPLFPGYIFAHVERAQRVRVLDVPGVLALVGGTGGGPAQLPDSIIQALRSGLHLRNAEPHPLLVVGRRARIRSGALAGMEGVVLRKKNSLRVVLTLEHIMQSISVEVDGEDLEPLQPAFTA